ncbi:MAG TPA: hypothetical protein VGH19_11910 [Verrucomicrobiae bacterium]
MKSLPGWIGGVMVLLFLLMLPGLKAADTSFYTLQASSLFAGTGVDSSQAVAAGPGGSAYFAGTFIGSISGSSGSITSNNGGLVDVFLTKLLPDGSTAWLLRMGGTSTERAECVAVDAVSGRVYVGGQFEGSAVFGSTNLTAVAASDGFIACYEGDGTFVWVRQIGGTGQESVMDIKVAADGIHACGRYNSTAAWGETSFQPASGSENMFLIRANADGVPQAETYVVSSASIQPERMVVQSSGQRIVAGKFSGLAFFPTMRNSNGSYDVFVAAYDSAGALQWVITGGGSDFDEAISLVSSTAGGYLLGMNVSEDSDGQGQITDASGSQSLPLIADGMRLARISESGAYTSRLAVNGVLLGGLAESKRGVLQVAANFSGDVNLGSTTVSPPDGQPSVFVASYLDSGELAGVATVSSAGYTGLLDMVATSGDGLALAGLSTTSLKHNGQTLATGHASLNAFTMLLAPPEMRLRISHQSNQVRVTYPAYFYNASLWESTTLNSGSWSMVSGASAMAVGEMLKDFSATEAKRFFHLRFVP